MILLYWLFVMTITQYSYTSVIGDHPTHILLYPFKTNTSVFIVTFPLWCSENYTEPPYELSTNLTKYRLYDRSVVPVNDTKTTNRTQCVHMHVSHINGSWDHLLKNVSQTNTTEDYVYIQPPENHVFNSSYYTFFVYTQNITKLFHGLRLHFYSIPSIKMHKKSTPHAAKNDRTLSKLPLPVGENTCVCDTTLPKICMNHVCYNSYQHACPKCSKAARHCTYDYPSYCENLCQQPAYKTCSWCTSQKSCQCSCPYMKAICTCTNYFHMIVQRNFPREKSSPQWSTPLWRNPAVLSRCPGSTCTKMIQSGRTHGVIDKGQRSNAFAFTHTGSFYHQYLNRDRYGNSKDYLPRGVTDLSSGFSNGKKRKKRSTIHHKPRIMLKDFWFDHISNSSKDLQDASKILYNMSLQHLQLKVPAFFRYNVSKTMHQGT
ncbi:glycoprotein ORF-R [Elephant endotheliotropic herpesvirus 3A]|uniref:Glycoprotein ORF-R n=1 Tax=Elephant endotheliotropic herpesvirus 3A TaxID=1329409 RepID=A0A866VSW4_9BETA|nr:glycoprotein ORF-R [Elephant endotheliotropic herpesvirus 3A]QOE74471.1 glycoprotein ORF-R [Elephant endotheliotropic herpesvirus 3A]